MEVFDFDYHKSTTAYPEQPRIQLGKSWVFSPQPSAPDQRVITLYFNGMYYYCDPITGVPNDSVNPKLNFWRLEKFYQYHGTWRDFSYVHPVYGALVCKFNKPLQTPKPVDNVAGLLEAFSVEFLEIP